MDTSLSLRGSESELQLLTERPRFVNTHDPGYSALGMRYTIILERKVQEG